MKNLFIGMFLYEVHTANRSNWYAFGWTNHHNINCKWNLCFRNKFQFCSVLECNTVQFNLCSSDCASKCHQRIHWRWLRVFRTFHHTSTRSVSVAIQWNQYYRHSLRWSRDVPTDLGVIAAHWFGILSVNPLCFRTFFEKNEGGVDHCHVCVCACVCGGGVETSPFFCSTSSPSLPPSLKKKIANGSDIAYIPLRKVKNKHTLVFDWLPLPIKTKRTLWNRKEKRTR